MRPDFSDLTIESSVEEQASAPENQSPWITPEGIPVKKEFEKGKIQGDQELRDFKGEIDNVSKDKEAKSD